jgi:hypothetical protein
VTVTTRCEGHTVEVRFRIVDPQKPPQIEARILDTEIRFSTRVEAEFAKHTSPARGLHYAQAYLRYFPCRALANGQPHETVWDRALQADDACFFKEANCDGFVEPSCFSESVTVLCRYEHILTTCVSHFITGGRYMNHDLRDYYQNDFPYVPLVDATVNCDALSVTISRDSFLLDCTYTAMKRTLAKVLLRQLAKRLEGKPDADLVLANQYVLRQQLRAYLTSEQRTSAENDVDAAVIQALARAKVYRLNGRRKLVSLEEIFDGRSPDTPIFYAPHRTNLRWLGGAFRHDFIILPSPCQLGDGAPGFYDALFKTVFEDIVNLDTVGDDHDKIRALVERGIVSKQALTPKCRLLGRRALTPEERKLAGEFDALLADPNVRGCITRQLHLSAREIRTAYFDVSEDGITIATGLFDENGNPLVPEPGEGCTNLEAGQAENASQGHESVVLGLRRDHALIRFLIGSEDPDRAAYGLTYLAREIGLCQKRLVPYSPFYWTTVEQLAANMRRALTRSLAS